jgi:predicted MFS family arabinose efflux permease
MARDLRLFYLFRLLATSYLWVPVSVLLMQQRGLSFSEIMVLGALYCAVVVLVEVPTGVFADRIGRRRSMMLGTLAMAGSCVVAWRADSFEAFALAEALAAVSMALCSGADSAYLFDLLREHGRLDEYGHRESTASALHLAGSAVACAAGGLLGQVDLALPYLVTAAVSLLAFVVAAAMREERPASSAARRPPAEVARAWLAHMRAAGGMVRRSGRLAWLIGYSAVVFVILRAAAYAYQPFLSAQGFDPAATGLVYAASYLLAALVAMRTPRLRRRFGDEPLLWALLAGLAGSFVALAEVTGPVVVLLLAAQAVANGLYSPLVKPLLNREIADSRLRATVLSVESIVRRAAMGAFAPVAGLYGAHATMLMCGGLGLLGLLALAGSAARTPSWRGSPEVR